MKFLIAAMSIVVLFQTGCKTTQSNSKTESLQDTQALIAKGNGTWEAICVDGKHQIVTEQQIRDNQVCGLAGPCKLSSDCGDPTKYMCQAGQCLRTMHMCAATSSYGRYEQSGGCNSYGCFSANGGCNPYGCWEQNGGCNPYGCWFAEGKCEPSGCARKSAGKAFACLDTPLPASTECLLNADCTAAGSWICSNSHCQQLLHECTGSSVYGNFEKNGGCNSYGCYSALGGCGPYGCWEQGGGCNPYGCWYAGGSCDPNSCARKSDGKPFSCLQSK